MSYDIRITRVAEEDLNSAAEYIEFVLHDPKAADDLLDEAEKKICELSTFPEKFALVDDPVLKAWGIRLTLVKNYLVFYVISEDDHTIYIVRFLYGKRDWITILKRGFSIE